MKEYTDYIMNYGSRNGDVPPSMVKMIVDNQLAIVGINTIEHCEYSTGVVIINNIPIKDLK